MANGKEFFAWFDEALANYGLEQRDHYVDSGHHKFLTQQDIYFGDEKVGVVGSLPDFASNNRSLSDGTDSRTYNNLRIKLKDMKLQSTFENILDQYQQVFEDKEDETSTLRVTDGSYETTIKFPREPEKPSFDLGDQLIEILSAEPEQSDFYRAGTLRW